MPKGGSGFGRSAAGVAASMFRGSSGSAGTWRLGGSYEREVRDLYNQLYRNTRTGIQVTRDARGRVERYMVSRASLERVSDLANRMAKDVQVYNPAAAEEYARQRSVWGKAVRVNSADLKEFRDSIRAGDTMRVNVRGGRNAVDAATRARNAGWNTNQANNASILREANEQMNATSRQIWRPARDLGAGYQQEYSSQITRKLLEGFKRAESSAYRRRRR